MKRIICKLIGHKVLGVICIRCWELQLPAEELIKAQNKLYNLYLDALYLETRLPPLIVKQDQNIKYESFERQSRFSKIPEEG